MKIIVCKDYAEMSAKAADIVAAQVTLKPNCVLGLATGSTPEGMYACLVKKYEAGELDFSAVRSINLDEYYPITPDNDQSYRYFMNYHLFDRVNIDKANTNVPNGLAEDGAAEGARYEALIASLGGIDLQILGIGQNGHIGFNEPGDELIGATHLTSLCESTIDANSRFFETRDDVPRHAITMGMDGILSAECIVLVASGKEKHDALVALLSGKYTTNAPVTLLRSHKNVYVFCDEAAYNG